MFNLKNIQIDLVEIYSVGFRNFQKKIKNLEPQFDDLPMTTLQRLKTRIYHLGCRLQEISSYPNELISHELFILHKAMKDYAAIFEFYYSLPTKERRKIYVEISRMANLFVKTHGFIFKKYTVNPVDSSLIDKTGKRLIEISFELYQWHLRYEKNLPEAASSSN
jgi:hypothetical protein